MANPTVHELKDDTRFRLLAELTHQDLVGFIREYFWRKKSWVIAAHCLFSLATLAAWIVIGSQKHRPFDVWLTTFGNGVLSFIVLLPLHELIHGAVYKLCGAKDIRFGGSLKQFYAYAVAHRFVIGQRDFAWVAVTPFIVINALLVLLAVVFPAHSFYLIAVLLFHTAGTSGDFAMLNFLWLHRRADVFTYDEADAKVTYFYGRIRPGS